jgi:hypothetical protein
MGSPSKELALGGPNSGSGGYRRIEGHAHDDFVVTLDGRCFDGLLDRLQALKNTTGRVVAEG